MYLGMLKNKKMYYSGVEPSILRVLNEGDVRLK